jgi:hypothetical protein
MVTAIATIASAVASAATSTSTSRPDAGEQGECRLLGPFALIVQLALGGLALMSLVYKRWRERPQRPLKIWFFDVSKQVFGSVLVHIANVFMSMLTSGRLSIKLDPATVQTAQRLMARGDGGDDYAPNPCSFYLLNLAIDVRRFPCVAPEIPVLMFVVDHSRHSHPDHPAPDMYRSGLAYKARSASGVDTIWQLWQPAERMVVAQAVTYILLRTLRHEGVRIDNILGPALDLPRG